MVRPYVAGVSSFRPVGMVVVYMVGVVLVYISAVEEMMLGVER